MSSMNFIFFLILAATLNPITASLSNSKATSPAKFIQPISYELSVNDSSSGGGARFEKDIGQPLGVKALASANKFILDNMYQGQKPPGKVYPDVVAIVESFSELGVRGNDLDPYASTRANRILVDSDYIMFFTGDIRSDFTGIMYQQSTRVWQWNGNGTASAGLITGIADYVRLKGGRPSVNWAPRGSGDQWDHGNEVTAYFLDYLDGVKKGSVAELNAMTTDHYSDAFFTSIFGRSVDDLWVEYKSMNTSSTSSSSKLGSLKTVYLMHLLPCVILLPWPTNARYRV